MKRTSKYLNKEFDNGWVCTHIGIANVQGKKSKAPGTRNYYYICERRTSDDKADKIVRLNSTEAAIVYRGEKQIEEIVESRLKTTNSCVRNISYHFGN